MAFNVQIKSSIRITEHDKFASDDRVTAFNVFTTKITGASAHNHTYRSISAGLSAQVINLEPVASGTPAQFIFIQSDQPINIRLNSGANSAVVSESYTLFLVNSGLISNLSVDVPGSLYAANLSVRVVRGGSLNISIPLP